MAVQLLDDPAAFLDRAGPLLLADESRHNLILGLACTLRDRPDVYPEHRLWLVEDAGRVVGAALRTPPYGVVLGPVPRAAATALADAIEDELPGAVGALPDVDEFGAAWHAKTGARVEQRFAQGVYALERVLPPRPATGAARRAVERDLELIRAWLLAFSVEALHEESPDEERLERTISSRLSADDSGFVLWEDGGPVSLCGFGNPTPNGIRIGPVYTPPELRGRGYASALTAAVSAERLAAGRRFCFLYTDLANPTSNRIYTDIGYERVCESRELAFS